tara:strand:+ start:11048 stop:11218 length:171 start_codon:yes stop_codon:yes gene_type:complete
MARKSNRKAAAAAPVADVEAVSKPGMGIDEGVVFTTFILLALAITCVVMANGHYTA